LLTYLSLDGANLEDLLDLASVQSFTHAVRMAYVTHTQLREKLDDFFKFSPLDGANLEVLRDLAILQIHTRDLEALCETRLAILQLK
jgi:hypothetical protein